MMAHVVKNGLDTIDLFDQLMVKVTASLIG